MKHKAYISGAVYLPISQVDTSVLKKELHVKEKGGVRITASFKEIRMFHYREINGEQYIAVPRVYGERFLKDFEVIDWSAEGEEDCLSILKEIELRDHQLPFIDNVLPLL